MCVCRLLCSMGDNLLRDEHTCCLVADFLAKGIFEGGDGISRLKDELLVRQA